MGILSPFYETARERERERLDCVTETVRFPALEDTLETGGLINADWKRRFNTLLAGERQPEEL